MRDFNLYLGERKIARLTFPGTTGAIQHLATGIGHERYARGIRRAVNIRGMVVVKDEGEVPPQIWSVIEDTKICIWAQDLYMIFLNCEEENPPPADRISFYYCGTEVESIPEQVAVASLKALPCVVPLWLWGVIGAGAVAIIVCASRRGR